LRHFRSKFECLLGEKNRGILAAVEEGRAH
jgi:hypothetical protein